MISVVSNFIRVPNGANYFRNTALRQSWFIFSPTESLLHRSDSVWGTDYIANPFFLNWKVSRTTIKNLRWQLGGEIIQVTFRKSSTLLVQKLKKKLEWTEWWSVPCCTIFVNSFFLKLLDQQCWRFSEGYLNNFSTKLSSLIFDCYPRNFLIQEKQNGNVISTSHWIRPVF